MPVADFWQEALKEAQDVASKDREIGAKTAALLQAGWQGHIANEIDTTQLSEKSAGTGTTSPEASSSAQREAVLSEAEFGAMKQAAVQELNALPENTRIQVTRKILEYSGVYLDSMVETLELLANTDYDA